MVKSGDGILKGLNEMANRLVKEAASIQRTSMKGLIRSAILIRRDMEKASPKIPVDTGNLRYSWFTVTSMSVGAGKTASFKGDNASVMSAEHNNAIGQAKALTMAETEPLLIMGFSANYAVWVHENVGAQFHGRKGYKRNGKIVGKGRPGSGAKFFEQALSRNRFAVLQILKETTTLR